PALILPLRAREQYLAAVKLVGHTAVAFAAVDAVIVPRAPRSPLFPYTTLFRSPGSAIAGMPASEIRPMSRPSRAGASRPSRFGRSEEHTSELQSRRELVCRLLLEKKRARAPAWRMWPSQSSRPLRAR